MNQLLLTLRYFALGDFLISVGDFAGIDKGTASRTIKKVSVSIACLAPAFIKFPNTQEEIAKAQENFFRIASFPRVCGTIDCTHIRIKSPGGDNAEEYRGRKGYFSLNVRTVASCDLKILDIVCRLPDSAHDQTIFNNSRLKARLESGEMGNRVLLCDSGYTACHYLLPPITSPRIRAENIYNESQIRTRNVVERSYGVRKRRFPVLCNGITLQIERAEAIIIPCSVLHNMAIDMNEGLPPHDPVFQAAIDMSIADERDQDAQVPDKCVADGPPPGLSAPSMSTVEEKN
ncbi:putative nuclease HARBI1 [Schistocerca nitens]|uniref:putative nuclease HARBI1 n=1 Tax=Schistocerca nitens TaxID=7011 RepID=UPI0021172DE2|nr:putative nuclease HARBI1 [Schistocerca nitens]